MHIFYLDFIRVYNEGTLNLARDFGVSERQEFYRDFGILGTGWIY